MSDSITSRPNGGEGGHATSSLEPLAKSGAPAVRVALRRADRHAGGLGDLLERVAERVLEHDDLRLLGEMPASESQSSRRSSEMRTPRVGSSLDVAPSSSASGSCDARLAPLGGVAARVDDEPVQPGRELRLAAELLEADADLRERFLRRVARVLGVPQEMPREPLDPRGVARSSASSARASPSFARVTRIGSLSFS